MLLLAAADDTGEHRSRPPSGIDPGRRRAGSRGRRGLWTSRRRRGPRARCVTHWCARPIYQAATGAATAPVHRALADALTGLGDPDREAWHRAAAAEGPDPDVVAALELVGSRAERRGAYVVGAGGLRTRGGADHRSATAGRAEFAAARNAWACGQAVHARALLSAARAARHRPGPAQRHRPSTGAHRGQPRLGDRRAPDLRRGSPRRPRRRPAAGAGDGRRRAIMRTYGADSGAMLPAGDIDLSSQPRPIRPDRVPQADARRDDPGGRGRLGGAAAALDVALAIGRSVDDLDVLGNLGNAALQLGDDAAQQRFYSLALSRAREAGRRHGGHLRPAATVLRLPRRGGPGQRCAAVPRRHSRSARAWGNRP